jgi:hypothetical protein
LKKNSSEYSSNRNTIESSDIEPVKLLPQNEFKDTATASSDTNTTAVASGVRVVRVFTLCGGVVKRSQLVKSELDLQLPRIPWKLPPEVARKVCPQVY